MKTELVKIVFQDGTQEDKQLSITVDSTKDEQGKTSSIEIALPQLDAYDYKPLVIKLYYEILDVLLKVKMGYDENGQYPDLHIITRDEYKEYVTKVLGIKIPDQEK